MFKRINILALVISLLMSVAVMADGKVDSQLQVFAVEMKKNGKEKLVESDSAEPGTVLEYRLSYKNKTKKGIKITNADALVPENTEYIQGSNKTKADSQFLVSIDYGKTFEQEPVKRTRKVNDEEVEYVVPVSEYTNVRWQSNQVLKGKSKQVFYYRVKVK